MTHDIFVKTHGERFYNITSQVERVLAELLKTAAGQLTQFKGQQTPAAEVSGILHLFLPHTSCGLAVSEAYDQTAREDMQEFLVQLAPRNQDWYTHTVEGEDDSPSHMKSLLLHHHLSLIVQKGKMLLGRWQGIYLAEFRDNPHSRQISLKFLPDFFS